MKSSLWFDASMLALILVVSLVCAAFDKSSARHAPASAEQPSQAQPQRLASGS
ncbi:MAG: hypothetical protein WDO56_08750 [Gammaproteobacteria bacterium]